MRGVFSGGIPMPVSERRSKTYFPRGAPSGAPSSSPENVSWRVPSVRIPPSGLASRALMHRLRPVCSSWPASPSTAGRPTASSVRISIDRSKVWRIMETTFPPPWVRATGPTPYLPPPAVPQEPGVFIERENVLLVQPGERLPDRRDDPLGQEEVPQRSSQDLAFPPPGHLLALPVEEKDPSLPVEHHDQAVCDLEDR